MARASALASSAKTTSACVLKAWFNKDSKSNCLGPTLSRRKIRVQNKVTPFQPFSSRYFCCGMDFKTKIRFSRDESWHKAQQVYCTYSTTQRTRLKLLRCHQGLIQRRIFMQHQMRCQALGGFFHQYWARHRGFELKPNRRGYRTFRRVISFQEAVPYQR